MTSLSELLDGAYREKRVLVTGHNGFVGSWLTYILASAGALVTGLSLEEEPGGLAETLELSSLVDSRTADVGEAAGLRKVIDEVHPEIVFHLAAQALVLPSYEDPIHTWTTNVMGTANVLDALRREESTKACIVITSDKCYATAPKAHVETDPLGGDDPYSASKAGAEIVAHSYRQSYFADGRMGLATARAGNIIGGGDQALQRIVPDCVRAIRADEPLLVRHPEAVRPWQHVLDAVAGYLRLGEALLQQPAAYSSAWNFGPPPQSATPVGDFVTAIHAAWEDHSGLAVKAPIFGGDATAPERTFLTLDSTKAKSELGWDQLLDLGDTIDLTVEWYATQAKAQSFDARSLTQQQIDRYLQLDASRVADLAGSAR